MSNISLLMNKRLAANEMLFYKKMLKNTTEGTRKQRGSLKKKSKPKVGLYSESKRNRISWSLMSESTEQLRKINKPRTRRINQPLTRINKQPPIGRNNTPSTRRNKTPTWSINKLPNRRNFKLLARINNQPPIRRICSIRSPKEGWIVKTDIFLRSTNYRIM